MKEVSEMTKEILIYDKGDCVGQVEVDVATDDLVSTFTCLAEDGSPIYVVYLADMDYGILIPKELYCRIEAAVDERDEEE